LIAADTGILRRLDAKQKSWLEASLARAGTTSSWSSWDTVLRGRCLSGSRGSGFEEILKILQRAKVDVAMAGDTHDFEFYKQKYTSGTNQRRCFTSLMEVVEPT
jgi:hypothetical protein